MDNGGGTGNPDRFRKIKDCFMEEVLALKIHLDSNRQ